ncbi:MAG: radical SAM protein [Clostridia bacterium]|nr:radical SAM protein [Clostridia bacterium]
MFYKLHEKLLLRGWQKLPYAVVEKGVSRPLFITAKEMQALQLCNGLIDTSLPLVPQEIRELLGQIEKRGLITRCQRGDTIRPEQEYKLYPARYIRTAHWSITGHCNYRCKHCYMSAPDAKFGELSHEAIMSIVQQLVDCGVMEVSLTGGEPLVRKDFMEIVDALLAGGITITTIYSNGKLVTDELLDALDKRGIHPEFNMSYDGTEGWHDWLRGIPNAGRIVEDAFLRCREKGFPTGAEMCIHQGNKHLLRDTVNKLAELGCRSLKTTPISNVGAWKEGGYGESISIDELYQLYLDYIPHYYADGMPLSIQLGGFFSASPGEMEAYDIPSMKNCANPDKTCVCGHARMVMYISAEGRVLPCMALSGMDIQQEFPLIPDIGLANCLTDSRYMRLIDTRATEVLEHNPECRNCEHALQCLGGCRASALETHPTDILAPDAAICSIFKGGWVEKIDKVMQAVSPGAKRWGTAEQF